MLDQAQVSHHHLSRGALPLASRLDPLVMRLLQSYEYGQDKTEYLEAC